MILEVGAILGRIERREFEKLSPRTYDQLKAECERQARAHAKRSPNAPPFAAPVHWAAHTVTGHGWT